mmetsp:Transcript_63644/g.163832  ORF Transcript_63644/g.163832 Transcript_63644/m.163832 type:complete len:557 (-) Transcript_63644:178-1848(-)
MQSRNIHALIVLGLVQLGTAHDALQAVGDHLADGRQDDDRLCSDSSDADTCLMQVHNVRAVAPKRTSSCTSLQNLGSHSTVRVKVGTPPQVFDVVADTGSDDLIIDSCVCQDKKHCDTKDKCFRGTGKSSTFSIKSVGVNTMQLGRNVPTQHGGPPEMVLSFGSGQVACNVATDVAAVGNVKAMMNDSLLLMVDRALQIEGPFEGILGLGVPKAEELRAMYSKQAAASAAAGMRKPAADPAPAIVPKPFLKAANIDRFSLCFNADNSDGVLRLGGELPEATAHDNLGQMHWGLDFRGVSIGNETAPVIFCDPSKKEKNQTTTCGAIPDSGTTVMMGAPEHLMKLFTNICNEWPRCVKAAQAHPKLDKLEVFHILLMSCMDWSKDGDVSEMPSLFFNLAGAEGTEQRLELPPAAYIMRVKQEEVKHVHQKLMGAIPVDLEVPTGRMVEVCTPAFGAQEYTTKENGPVWIFGTPIFYLYNVAYNLGSNPPAISFSSAPCGTCSADGEEGPVQKRGTDQAIEVGFLDDAAKVETRTSPKIAWRHSGPLRVPNMDTSMPL